MVVPLIPLFAKELGSGVALAGLVVAARGLGSMVGDVPSGLVTTRFGGRKTMAAGALLTGASALAMGVSTGVALLAAFTLMNGVAFALWHVSRLTYLTGAVPSEYRGRALSLVGGTSRVGIFIGPIVGGLLGQAGIEPSAPL